MNYLFADLCVLAAEICFFAREVKLWSQFLGMTEKIKTIMFLE